MNDRRTDYFLRFLFCSLIFSKALFATEPEVRRAVPVASPDFSQSNVNDIRIAPVTATDAAQVAEAQLSVAEGFFNRKQFDMAVPEYEKFLKLTSPGQPHRDQALFHLGESLRSLGNGFASQKTYEQLLTESTSGEFAAAAAYRLGEYYSGRKETKSATEAFAQAAQLSTNASIKNAALYQEALCHDELGEQTKATSLLDEVSKSAENNPSRLRARLLLAAHEEKSGDKEKALADYQSIIHESSGEVAAEALVKAAMISNDLGKREQALQFFETAAAMKDSGEWPGIAALGSMKLFYATKDFKKVLLKSDQASASSNLQSRSEAFLLAAHAQRQLGNPTAALSLYDKILQEFPGTDPANEAAFYRLLTLQATHDPKLIAQIEEYLLATTDAHRRAQAELLKAEVFFQAGNYSEAAQAYHQVTESDLSAELKADALYKEAWSLDHSGDAKGALSLLATLAATYPKSPQLVTALIQQASLKQKTGDLPGAVIDYSTFINAYPQAPERELALQQKALIQGELRDNKAMVETFQQLLHDYPNSAAAGQANFWIGCTSFENKDYTSAIPFLEKSRQLDPKHFGERAGVRLLLSHYYLEQIPEASHEAASLQPTAVPAEVSRWLGLKAYQRGDMAQTEHFLSAVVKSGKNDLLTVEVETALAHALVKQEKFKEAEAPAKKALELSTDPATRAEAVLTLATLQKGLKKYDEADHLANEALLLQPEGNLNITARLLQADLFFLREHYDEAARAYMAVALLTNDPTTTPHALRKAAEAYHRANNPAEAQKAEQELKKFVVRSS